MGSGWRDTSRLLSFFSFFLFRKTQNCGDQHLSVGGVRAPVSLQPGSGDSYCKEGKSGKLKQNKTLWFPY